MTERSELPITVEVKKFATGFLTVQVAAVIATLDVLAVPLVVGILVYEFCHSEISLVLLVTVTAGLIFLAGTFTYITYALLRRVLSFRIGAVIAVFLVSVATCLYAASSFAIVITGTAGITIALLVSYRISGVGTKE